MSCSWPAWNLSCVGLATLLGPPHIQLQGSEGLIRHWNWAQGHLKMTQPLVHKGKFSVFTTDTSNSENSEVSTEPGNQRGCLSETVTGRGNLTGNQPKPPPATAPGVVHIQRKSLPIGGHSLSFREVCVRPHTRFPSLCISRSNTRLCPQFSSCSFADSAFGNISGDDTAFHRYSVFCCVTVASVSNNTYPL